MENREARRKKEREDEKIKRKLDSETPIMTFNYPKNYLQVLGPIIDTYITITDPHKKILEQLSLVVPAPVRCRFLIDTGANRTLVKHEIAEQSGIKLINASNPIQGVGVDTTGKSYIGRITFICESKKVPGTKYNISVDTEIVSGTLNNNESIDGLIGRDVLQYFELRYDGKNSVVSLTFLK